MKLTDMLVALKPAIQTLEEYYMFKSIGIDKDKMNFELSIQKNILKSIRHRDSLTLHRIMDFDIHIDSSILMLYTTEAIHASFLEYFLVFGTKIRELPDEELEMLLMQSIRSGDLKILEFFSKIKNWNSEIKTKSLQTAASSGNESVFKFLISSGFSQIEESNWLNLFYLACYGDSVEVVKYLYSSKDPEFKLPEPELSECLQIVTQKGDKILFDFLLELGASIHSRTKKDESLLHCVCSKPNAGNYDLLQHLLVLEMEVNHKSNVGTSVLHEACRNASIDMIQLLIENGANINAVDNYGDTPIVAAMWKGRQDVVDMLIRAGANIDRKVTCGMTIRDLARNLKIDLSATTEASVATGGSTA